MGPLLESDKTGPTSITVDVKPVLATTKDDDLIWSGEAINGRAGTDTVHLRYGEELTGKELADKLSNIEVLDLGVDGANKITDLTAKQVKKIIGAGDILTIKGSEADSVSLSGDWIDHGNGSYTGTVNGHDVTLKLEGGVQAATQSLQSFSMFSEQQNFSFGLASLDEHEPTQQTILDAAPISIEDVLYSATENDDLTSILPVEHRDLSPPSIEAAGGQSDIVDTGRIDMMSSLEDEIMRSLHYEV